MKTQLLSFLILTVVLINSCLEGGTHGSIKYYQYRVSKQILEKAVKSVINESITLKQDSVKGYYNNDSIYTTIYIISNMINNEYTFRYGGNKKYWDTSKISDISIAYAYNSEKNGGSERDFFEKDNNYKLRKELIDPFEKEFISRINKKLHMEPFREK